MSQRDRLLGRQRPWVDYPLLVDDPSAARRAAEIAAEQLRISWMRADEGAAEAQEAARKALDAAQAKLDACYEKITVRALPHDEFEELANAHPPRPGTEDTLWNQDTFPKACFLACVEGDLSEAEWAEFIDKQVSEAERADLFSAATTVNARLINPAVPKG